MSLPEAPRGGRGGHPAKLALPGGARTPSPVA